MTPEVPLDSGGSATSATPAAPAVPPGSTTPTAAAPERRIRPTVRLRLTLWYAGLFLLAGILLLGLNYALVRQSLVDAPARSRAAVAERLGIPLEEVEPRPPREDEPPPDQDLLIGGLNPRDLIREIQEEMADDTLRQLLLMSTVALAVILAGSVGLGWVMAGRMLRPLHAITETARHLSEADLPSQRIALAGPHDELKELADTFDAMLGRLDAAFTAQRDFVANASHELRTPLTIIRAEIDVALDDRRLSRTELEEMADAVRDAVDRSERLIDSLLVLARSEEVSVREPVDLAAVAARQAADLTGTLDATGPMLTSTLEPAVVTGDPVLLDRLVANLLDNAVRHNVPKGWVRLGTTTEGEDAFLVVSNSALVMDATEVERLFERFYRPDRSRSRTTGGFGLGLSIVRSVALAHGGSATARPLPGGGLEITVRIPARRSTGATADKAEGPAA